MSETVLIVDDEDSVRRTFEEWLRGSSLDVVVVGVSDAESALLAANERTIDLAILDWNLGSGSDGLRLLEDLVEFHPDLVAILVTGFAQQATPLDALRMGVRDYLDKNQDLNRETFLAAVRKQLQKIIPAKRQRELDKSLSAFRESIGTILPLVRGSAALNDPVPLPEAVRTLFRFLLRETEAPDGVLLVRHAASDGTQTTTAYDPAGKSIPVPEVPFHKSLAASVVSFQEPCIMNDIVASSSSSIELMPFEKNRRSILAAPLRVGPGVHVILELFDKPEFTDVDRRKTAIAAELGAELLRHALAERQTHRMLFDAVEAALKASHEVSSLLVDPTADRGAPSESVLESLKRGMDANSNAVIDSDTGLKLVEAVRVLAVRHGPEAVHHCVRMVESLRELLDGMTGAD